MKITVLFGLAVILWGCGPDRVLLMETKFDAPLRQKVAALTEKDITETLLVQGKCEGTIDAAMRREMIDAGAEVLSMNGELFSVRISSDDIFSLAALPFVAQVGLSRSGAPF